MIQQATVLLASTKKWQHLSQPCHGATRHTD